MTFIRLAPSQSRILTFWTVVSLVVALAPSELVAQSKYSEKAQMGFRATFCSVLASMDPDQADLNLQRQLRDEGESLLKPYFADLKNNRVGTKEVGPKIVLLDNLTRENPADYLTQLVWLQTKKGVIGRFVSDWRAVEANEMDRRQWKKGWVVRQLVETGCVDGT